MPETDTAASPVSAMDKLSLAEADESKVSVQEFSYRTFNDIADYEVVRHVGEKEKDYASYVPKINEIGQVFLDHKKHKVAGLSLSHRHFDLEEGEVKVARQNGNEVTIVAQKMGPEQRKKLIPYMFQVGRDPQGEPFLIPLEYVEHLDNKELLEICRKEYEAIQDRAFLSDFLKVLKEQDVEGLFGLILHSRDNIEIRKGETKLESGGDKYRSLLVRAFPKSKIAEDDEIVTTVSWQFREGKNGKIDPVGTCLSRSHGSDDEEKDPEQTCTHCSYAHCRHCGNHCGYAHSSCNHQCRGCNDCRRHRPKSELPEEED